MHAWRTEARFGISHYSLRPSKITSPPHCSMKDPQRAIYPLWVVGRPGVRKLEDRWAGNGTWTLFCVETSGDPCALRREVENGRLHLPFACNLFKRGSGFCARHCFLDLWRWILVSPSSSVPVMPEMRLIPKKSLSRAFSQVLPGGGTGVTFFTTFAGEPMATLQAGTSLVTIEFAATVHPSEIVTPGRITT